MLKKCLFFYVDWPHSATGDLPVLSMPYLQSGSTEIEHTEGMRLRKTKE